MTDRQPRSRRTPQEKATHALGVAQRAVDKLVDRRLILQDQLARLQPELDAAVRRRDYLRQDPALAGLTDDELTEVTS